MTASLVVAAHGSLGEPRSFLPALDHAEAIRERDVFDRVAAGFLQGEPALGEAVASVERGRLVVVPLFVCDGYCVGEVVPERVEANRRTGVDVTYAAPVGTHEGVTDVIHRRVTDAVGDRAGEVGLALLGHGSERGSANRETVEAHAARLRDRGVVGEVRSFFLEEDPRIGAVPTAFAAPEVVAVPAFVAEGHHVREDIPERLGLAGETDTVEATTIRYTKPIGGDPAVAEIVLERARAALDGGGADTRTTRTCDTP